MQYLRLYWDDIEELCIEIAREIKKSRLDFDIIIGLARGGLIPSRILSDLLDNNELYTVRVKFYSGIAETEDEPRIIHPVQIDVSGKNILLVDDIADTGRSLMLAEKHLNDKKAGKITVVTLIKKPTSKFIPNIYVQDTDAWVIFPWEVRETVRLLASKYNGSELQEELRQAEITNSESKEALEL